MEWEDSLDAQRMLEDTEREQQRFLECIVAAVEEWESNGLETICSKEAFIEKRLQQEGF